MMGLPTDLRSAAGQLATGVRLPCNNPSPGCPPTGGCGGRTGGPLRHKQYAWAWTFALWRLALRGEHVQEDCDCSRDLGLVAGAEAGSALLT